jgi:hypothetical protein
MERQFLEALQFELFLAPSHMEGLLDSLETEQACLVWLIHQGRSLGGGGELYLEWRRWLLCTCDAGHNVLFFWRCCHGAIMAVC